MNTIRNGFPEAIQALKPLLETAYNSILSYQIDPTEASYSQMQAAIESVVPHLAVFKPQLPVYKRRYIEVLESGVLFSANDLISCFDRAIYELHARVRCGEWGHLPWSTELRAFLDGRQQVPPPKLLASPSPTSKTLLAEGTGIGRGVVSGPARIVLSGRREFGRVEKGDILVCRMTDPDVILVLDRIAGLITDYGGTLCHAAILARTFSLPCLVGCGNATEVIRDGQQIRMSVADGTVDLLGE
jgi:phosphohistidine swiveling domain-containing protein